MWHVGINGQSKGPYTDEQLKALIETGAVTRETLVWKAGMAGWKRLWETDFDYGQPLPLASPPAFGAAAAGSGAPPVFTATESLSPWGYFRRCVTSYYANFEGRANRKEYWSYVLFWFLAIGVAVVIGAGVDVMLGNISTSGDASQDKPVTLVALLMIVLLGTLLPGLGVRVRRLHDLGLSGWMVLIALIPYLGGLALFIMSLIPGERAPNGYGPSTL